MPTSFSSPPNSAIPMTSDRTRFDRRAVQNDEVCFGHRVGPALGSLAGCRIARSPACQQLVAVPASVSSRAAGAPNELKLQWRSCLVLPDEHLIRGRSFHVIDDEDLHRTLR
jgi:hypothetical protein